MEAQLHNLFAYTYVLHVHPTLINGLTCGKGAKALCEELLGKDVLWIDICKPGYTLARICYEKMNAYKAEFGKDVQVLLLQNHGIFVADIDPEYIFAKKLFTKCLRTLSAGQTIDKTKRPSVEALLHNLFAYTYVLHVHPTLVNGLTCGKGAQTLCEQLLGKDVLWIDICNKNSMILK